MADLFERLREQLREKGWTEVFQWKSKMWVSPEGGQFTEDEAFKHLQQKPEEEEPS